LRDFKFGLAHTDFKERKLLAGIVEITEIFENSFMPNWTVVTTCGMSDIYKHPEEYNLEHSGDEDDTRFYLGLVREFSPKKVLELGCGTGRITLPLALEGGRGGALTVVGLKAEESRAHIDSETRRRLSYVKADMLTWRADTPFDLILIPCGSLSHILELEAQIRLFRQCFRNLTDGGRLIVGVNMPTMLLIWTRSISRRVAQ
jgi:SAM-dependent methyltransferase